MLPTTNHKEKTIGELVAEDFRKADIFKKYGIDFCCGGKEKLKDVCSKQGVDIEKIEKDFFETEQKIMQPENNKFIDWNADALIAHIVNVHHKYVLDTIPLLFEYSEKVLKAHGTGNPEVIEIKNLFNEAADDLGHHMLKEERILFPYILQLVNAQKNQEELEHPHFGTVENPIKMMEAEHEKVGDIFKNIKKLSNGFSPPEHACNTYQLFYFKLKEFQNDLHQHIHLENNILFPKALKLETQLFG